MILAAALLAFSGCGGGDEATHNAATVRTCLDGASVSTASEVDETAEKADAGAFAIQLPNGDTATLSFWNTSPQADAAEAAYRLYLEGLGKVERHGKLVVAWDQDPADESAEIVSGCL